MYEAFFGLRERPFDITPNPRFLLLTATHREALATLQYGLTAAKGLTLLLGDAGVGKTTLVRKALEQWGGAGHMVVCLNNPTLTRSEFFETLTSGFGLSPGAAESKAKFLAELTALLTARHQSGQITGLLIDEAQSLSTELLEEIRLLVNIESSTAKMLQVMLAGQPELVERLNQPGLRQLKQRVALRCVIGSLNARETAAFVAARIHIAGGQAAQIFTREAVDAIFRHANGIPRVISVIADNAMLAGFAASVRPVTRELVEEVCRDFDLQTTAAPDTPAPPQPEAGGNGHRQDDGPVEFDIRPARRETTLSGTHAVPEPVAVESPVRVMRPLFAHYTAKAKRRFFVFLN